MVEARTATKARDTSDGSLTSDSAGKVSFAFPGVEFPRAATIESTEFTGVL